MENLITEFLNEQQFKEGNEGVNNVIGLMSPYSTSLNDDQRIGIRTMGTDRDGIARMISRISNVHKDCLPRNEDPAKLDSALVYFDEMMEFRVRIAYLLEMVDDTSKALGIDIMRYVDRYTGYLQTARRGNTSLDAALDEVDEYNKRFANRPQAEDETPAAPPES